LNPVPGAAVAVPARLNPVLGPAVVVPARLNPVLGVCPSVSPVVGAAVPPSEKPINS